MRNIFFAAGALLFLLTTINFVNAQNQPRPAPTPAGAEESEEILDNSFLIEEAYNQEAGIIQHIGTFKRNNRGEFLFVFTQEIPIRSERHQFSYTIPVSRNADADGGASGVGDIALSYRYQLLKNKRVAIAPRATILIPTGDARRSLGNNTVGLQFNLPISTRLNRSFVAHSNAGATFVPRARNERGERADLKNIFSVKASSGSPNRDSIFCSKVFTNGTNRSRGTERPRVSVLSPLIPAPDSPLISAKTRNSFPAFPSRSESDRAAGSAEFSFI